MARIIDVMIQDPWQGRGYMFLDQSIPQTAPANGGFRLPKKPNQGPSRTSRYSERLFVLRTIEDHDRLLGPLQSLAATRSANTKGFYEALGPKSQQSTNISRIVTSRTLGLYHAPFYGTQLYGYRVLTAKFGTQKKGIWYQPTGRVPTATNAPESHPGSRSQPRRMPWRCWPGS